MNPTAKKLDGEFFFVFGEGKTPDSCQFCKFSTETKGQPFFGYEVECKAIRAKSGIADDSGSCFSPARVHDACRNCTLIDIETIKENVVNHPGFHLYWGCSHWIYNEKTRSSTCIYRLPVNPSNGTTNAPKQRSALIDKFPQGSKWTIDNKCRLCAKNGDCPFIGKTVVVDYERTDDNITMKRVPIHFVYYHIGEHFCYADPWCLVPLEHSSSSSDSKKKAASKYVNLNDPCSICKKPIEGDDAKFCPNCGTKIGQPEVTSLTSNDNTTSPSPVRKRLININATVFHRWYPMVSIRRSIIERIKSWLDRNKIRNVIKRQSISIDQIDCINKRSNDFHVLHVTVKNTPENHNGKPVELVEATFPFYADHVVHEDEIGIFYIKRKGKGDD